MGFNSGFKGLNRICASHWHLFPSVVPFVPCYVIEHWLFHSVIHTILSFWFILISARAEIDLTPSLKWL